MWRISTMVKPVVSILVCACLPWVVSSACRDSRTWTDNDTAVGRCSSLLPYSSVTVTGTGVFARQACAQQCLRDYPNCQAANFNNVGNACGLLAVSDPSPGVCANQDYLTMDLPPVPNTPVFGTQTDVGTCPEGWKLFGSYCYVLGPTPKNFIVSEWYCKEAGGSMASIHSHIENRFIAELARGNTGTDRVITGMVKESGMRDFTSFLWIDGSTVDFSYWAAGQPDKQPNPANCIFIDIGLQNQWVDASCYAEASYVCKKPSTI